MELDIELADGQRTSASARIPSAAKAMFVYAHGAGAPMTHPFMEDSSAAFADRDLATLRFNFPYAEAGRRRPDPPPRLIATIMAANRLGAELTPALPRFGGGKSMGGRMSSHAAVVGLDVRGLIFVGFPLHPAGKPSKQRADHLRGVDMPLLFVQGTRDPLAELGLIDEVTRGLGARARLHVVDGADHGFDVLKRSGRTRTEALAEIAEVAARFVDDVLAAD